MSHRLIFDLSFQELADFLIEIDEPPYRANQIWKGLYQQFWQSPDQFTNIPKSLRGKLSDNLVFSGLTPQQVLNSKDGETTKVLFTLDDGRAIETVLMRYHNRRSLCISTQAGCAMGCVFCATGQMGFGRNLRSGEISEQVIYFARSLKSQNEKLTNIILMGMGEPLHNFPYTLKAIDSLNNENGMKFGERRFTISSVGLIPEIQAFASKKRQINLAISLHAANDSLRSSLIPINKKYPLKDLIESCKEYLQITNRRITFEWALIQNINDSEEHARELTNLVRGLLCHVNIIPLNPTVQYKGTSTTHLRAQKFQSILVHVGIPCTIRLRRGIDIQAGCGQLATQAFS
jgi:23S rRNA (adenine2503-C2)-methyltransferase